MTVAYATVAQLETFLDGEAPDDAERLLERASEIVDGAVLASYHVSPTTSLPTDTDVAGWLRDAVCAQVEFWTEVGEEHDIAGMAGRQVSIGQLSIDKLPPVLAPRAQRILGNSGLLTADAWVPAWQGAWT